MSNKVFVGLIAVLVIGTLGFFALSGNKTPKQPQVGVSHPSLGGTHIQPGSSHAAYNSDPPSSGPHYADASAPTPWGVYTQQVPDEVFLHNEEHGGIIVTYKPDLPKDQIKKLQALFAPPYSDASFKPSKAVVTPRSKNTRPIELASWTFTFNLDGYDKAKIMDFYLQHIGKSPEPAAGPTNRPINQATNQ